MFRIDFVVLNVREELLYAKQSIKEARMRVFTDCTHLGVRRGRQFNADLE